MKELRLAGLAIAAAGSLLLTVYLLSLMFSPTSTVRETLVETATPQSDPAARRTGIETRLAAVPEITPFFSKLRETIPANYDAVLRKASTTEPGSAGDTPDVWLSDAVKIVRQSHGALAAKADAAPLSAIFKRQAAVLDELAKGNARLCVDFLYGGASEGFFQFAADHRSLVADLALAGLDADIDGQTKKIERDPPTDADFQALEAGLRERGLNDTEIATLLDGKSVDPPLPDERLCELGRLYLATMANLPDDARLRLYALAAGLMARS